MPVGDSSDARGQTVGVDAGPDTPGHLKPGIAISGPRGASTGMTLNGNNAVGNSHAPPNVRTFSGTSSAPTPVSGAVVNNGPGCIIKGQTAPSGTVIQTSLINTSTVISAQTPCLSAGATVTLVRPPMQTQITATAPNGTGSLALGAGVNAMHLSAGNTPGSLSLSSTGQVGKADSPKTLIAQVATSVAQPVRGSLMQCTSRTPIPSAVGPGPGGIRAIAPQVLAPRITQPQPSQPSVHNIQLPPGKPCTSLAGFRAALQNGI